MTLTTIVSVTVQGHLLTNCRPCWPQLDLVCIILGFHEVLGNSFPSIQPILLCRRTAAATITCLYGWIRCRSGMFPCQHTNRAGQMQSAGHCCTTRSQFFGCSTAGYSQRIGLMAGDKGCDPEVWIQGSLPGRSGHYPERCSRLWRVLFVSVACSHEIMGHHRETSE